MPLTLEQARSWLTDVLGSESAQQICEPMEKAAAEPAAKPAARTVRKIRSEAVV
ncbi:hypothetical protein SDC9_211723 [bioreactor metagenome]|uniref:Uncharacterized protein n=1 Tax=bioreactor metagenome TaxID=1076179 RepID=A0A645JWA7_9ZZZZ